MSNKEIYPYMRQGRWETSYNFPYKCAWLYLYDYEKMLSILKNEENLLKQKYIEDSEEIRNDMINHETEAMQFEVARVEHSAHLCICLAIEGFLNYYGVKRLGENYYKNTLERVGITEKISVLYLLCFEKRLERNDSLLKSIKDIFDIRNSMVHPKTKEIRGNFYISCPSKINNLHEAFEIMEAFVTSMCELDKEINREFTFRKPPRNFDK